MPRRSVLLIPENYYHIFNRSVGKSPILTDKRVLGRFMEILSYYRYRNAPLPFSRFLKRPFEERLKILKALEEKGDLLVEIICFCLMPNHYHLLLKQAQEKGIMIFARNFQLSFAKYFNIKNERLGPLFESRFKAVRVEDENQLLHLSRYIHINPYTSFVISKKEELLTYPWSSLGEYLGGKKVLCSPEVILKNFKNPEDYGRFILDRADYQRKLDEISHLVFE